MKRPIVWEIRWYDMRWPLALRIPGRVRRKIAAPAPANDNVGERYEAMRSLHEEARSR